ncbi:KilA-N domain-containing protein [Snodgrassella sp. CFCC 13594]|uniref:KilA-N domain-containing protein n=1 Tax=Snodgrassella sp. CFCC 13594 TaxID=1775559 RepID=UPI00082A7C35|nr:KilA-N domain-containing protein [Snodgrassella sp. CFCC 13594]
MNALIELQYQGSTILADDKAWFSATDVARPYGKRPVDWLKNPETERYVDALCRKYEVRKSHFIKTSKGRGKNGTWLHRKLAIPFARWLDVDMAIWLDEKLEAIIFDGQQWQQNRVEASKNFRMVCDALHDRYVAETGQKPRQYAYINESCRINKALTGKWAKLDREKLTQKQLDMLDSVLCYDLGLITTGCREREREARLALFVMTRLGGGFYLEKKTA